MMTFIYELDPGDPPDIQISGVYSSSYVESYRLTDKQTYIQKRPKLNALGVVKNMSYIHSEP